MSIVRTVQDVIDRYLQHMRVRFDAGDIGSLTYGKAKSYLTEFGRLFGRKKLRDAKPSDLLTFLVDHPAWRSPWTKNDAVGQIVSAFRWAVNEELIDCIVYKRPRTRYATQPRSPMHEAEYVALHRAAMAHGKRSGRRRRVHKNQTGRALRRAICWLRRSGSRTCELRLLQWRHVDWNASVCRLQDHKTAKVTGESRLIGLDPAVMRLLSNLHRQASTFCRGKLQPPPDDAHVFLNARGRPFTRGTFARVFRAFARKAGVREEVSAYSIRHMFVTTAIERGIGHRQIADAVGHRGTRLIEYYGRQTRQNSSYLSNTVAQILRRPRPEPRQREALG
jgi:integrase